MPSSLTAALVLFCIATAVIAVAGTYMSRVADALADRTGMGEALMGAFLLAGATSLPDFAATLSASIDGRAELAMSNVMGSMAVNLAFLAIADMAWTRANLEHAAASAANLMQSALLIALLVLPLLAMQAPALEWLGVHPVTLLIVLGYLAGVRLLRGAQQHPMWRPRITAETVRDEPGQHSRKHGLVALWSSFALLAVVTGIAGWTIMEAAKVIIDRTGIPDGVAGGVLTAIATSSPELVTTLAAVRMGALTLAVGNIVGTNFFNLLVVAAADVGYREGSIYQALGQSQMVWGLTALLMAAVLLVGLLRRETFGIARIGSESVLLVAIYLGTIALLVLRGG